MIDGYDRDDPNQGTKPPGSYPKYTWAQKPLAVVVVVLGLASKVLTAGWLTLIFGIAYLPVGVIHIVVHHRVHGRVAISKAQNAKPAPLALLLASHTFFLLGFLLQIDGGDGPSWMTIYYLVGGGFQAGYPSWWPGLWMNVLVFAPLVWTWARLLRRSSSPRD